MYNSLHVRCTVFFYNYPFRERDDVGACCNIAACNILTVEQIGRIFGVNRAKCDRSTQQLACDISVLIKSILSDWPIENPSWRPFSKMATDK